MTWDPLWDLEPEETLRWLYRHQVALSWDRVDGDDMLTLHFAVVPDGTATLKAICRSHELVPEVTGRLVAEARAKFNLE